MNRSFVGYIAALQLCLALGASVLSILLYLMKGDRSSSPSSSLKLIYKNTDLNSNIQSLYLNSTGITVIGHEGGQFVGVNSSTSNIVFKIPLSNSSVTAVTCDEELGVFYAGDSEGRVFYINVQYEVIVFGEILMRSGSVLAIHGLQGLDYELKTAFYTRLGDRTAEFFPSNKNVVVEETSRTRSGRSVFSADTAGNIDMNKKENWEYPVNFYSARATSTVVATLGIWKGEQTFRKFNYIFSLCILDNQTYRQRLIEGTAIKTLKVYGSPAENNILYRNLEFSAPVLQVQTTRFHIGAAQSDLVYILLVNGEIFKVNATAIFTPSIPNKDLDIQPIKNCFGVENISGFSVNRDKVAVFNKTEVFYCQENS